MPTSALQVARTGLEAQDARMRVIANNLANVGTTGFKRDRANFATLAYQDARVAGQRSSGETAYATGLNLGTLDAAEISFPALDLQLGMNEHASHYYFPGWHQQSSLITFIINQDVWDGLEETERAAIEEVCAANVVKSIAQGESIQLGPLEELKAQGTTIHQWSDEMLAAFQGGWDEVLAERSQDADFARVWKSVSEFRTRYAEWATLGYID